MDGPSQLLGPSFGKLEFQEEHPWPSPVTSLIRDQAQWPISSGILVTADLQISIKDEHWTPIS